jgi:hypothetical protein
VVNAVLARFSWVILDLGEADVVHQQSVHISWLVTVVETYHVQVVVLRERHQVAAPLGFLWTDKAVVLRTRDALGVLDRTASYRLMTLSK